MQRSNPHAYVKNGIKLYYPKAAGEAILYPNISYVIAADGSTATVEVLNDASADYITVKITDKNGAYVAHKFSPVATGDSQVIDTSSLDASCNWTIRVYAGIEPSSQGCDGANSDYCVTVCDPQGASGNTVPEGAQGLYFGIFDNGSTNPLFTDGYVAYGETIDLGTTYTAGDDLILNIVGFGDESLTDPVKKGLTISAVSITGDVTSFTDLTPVTSDGTTSLNPADDVTLDIALAGSYSAVVTLTSTDNAYENYTFTLTWTAV